MTFSPHEADNKVIILPLNAGLDIDWTFLETIQRFKDDKIEAVSNEARKGFVFDEDKYKDAVVMPWYRNQVEFKDCMIKKMVLAKLSGYLRSSHLY